MTRNELLLKMDNLEPDDELDSVNSMNALRAVFDLHKPDEPDFPDEWESCVECSGNGYVAMYPCQTIKVIEKEIG